MTKIKERSKLSPRYRCHNQQCKNEFDIPSEEFIEVTTYRSHHSDFWYDLHGELNARQLRSACQQPKAQFSIRRLDWPNLQNLLGKEFFRNFEAVDRLASSTDGHRYSKTRVRLGQSKFRNEMLQKYGNVCAFSGLNHPSGLDAAHLYSYANHGKHYFHGGLLLRKDLHRLFDLGLIVVEPKTLVINLASSLLQISQYRKLHEARLAITVSSQTRKWLISHWHEHNKSLPKS